MTKFFVWNDDGDDETDAKVLESSDARRAAQHFAENDDDGRSDGVYDENNGCVLNVRDAGS